MSILIYELTLTRVFSIIQWNYLAFMIISIAFLGYGASGTFLTIIPSLTRNANEENLFVLLPRFSLLYGLSILLSIFLITWIPFDLYRINIDRYQFFYLIIYYLAVALPFFFAGICISLTISILPENVGKLYFFDLTGASVGCLAFLFFSSHLKTIDLIILLAIFGLVVTFFFSLLQNKKIFSLLSLFLILTLIFINISSYSPFQMPINPYKELFTFLRYPDTEIDFEDRNSFSHIKVIKSSAVKYAPGLSLNFKGRIPEQLALLTDDTGISPITKFDGNKNSLHFIDYLTNSLGFYLTEKREDVLVIGAGGGLDILSAAYYSSKNIKAIELNPIIINLMKKRYTDFSGNIFNKPGVTILQGEGRSTLNNLEKNFDLIQISMVGSATASSGGFQSISENYLYTVEGMIDFLTHISDNGIICITRGLLFPPRESVRLTAIALEALKETGIENPENHISLIRSWGTTTFICSKKPFDRKMIDIVISFCQERSFDPIYFPGVRPNQVNNNHKLEKPYYYQAVSDLIKHFKGDHVDYYYHHYFYNISPATDNRPFFFYFLKWKNIPDIISNTAYWQPMIEWGNLIVFATLIQGIIFSFFFIFLPLFIKRVTPGKGWYFPVLYFAALGLGYMLIEISFIQKFILYLTNPTFASSAIIFSFLFFSGLGSRYSQRFRENPFYYIKRIIPLICFILVIYQILMPFIFQQTLFFSVILRFLTTAFLIAPLAFFMGMPFPIGISIIAARKDKMIPWAWAANNFCSVLASVSAVIIALSFGFQAVGYLAAGVYLVGLFAIIYNKT